MGKVRVRVRDSALAKPHPLAFTGEHPTENSMHLATVIRASENSENISFIPTASSLLKCQSGKMTLEAVKGFEYWPAQRALRGAAGREAPP